MITYSAQKNQLKEKGYHKTYTGYRKERTDMIVQPEKVTRNVNESFYEDERKQIATLNNEFFQNVELTDQENKVLVWLCGLDGYTVEAVVSAFKKVMESR